MVCADLWFEGGAANPLRQALPDWVVIPMARLGESAPLLHVLLEEATGDRCGRQLVLDRLFEVLLVQLLRELMSRDGLSAGVLAGLAHPKLRHALTAMHDEPARAWDLEALAEHAGMSRTSFANTFRAVVGQTPGQYLQGWRLALAGKLLQQGGSMRRVADAVGYADEASLSRAFKARHGLSPRDWRKTLAPVAEAATPRGALPA